MTVVAKSRSGLYKEKCDFNKLVFILVVFSCINLHLTAKNTSEKLVAK